MALVIAVFLVVVNGFFVAAEFALVKVRGTQMALMVELKRPFAKTAQWLVERLDGALSACQLGITMASLGLGWVAEPAFVALLDPAFEWVGLDSETARHAIAVTISFTLITAVHLVIGEQAPKIFAIRRPELMVLWCALPLKWFYLATWPLMLALNASTSFLLGFVGIKGESGHEVPHTEEEIRALVKHARVHGELTSSEQRLIHAVFEFDDMVCRRVMVPRGELQFIDVNDSVREGLELVQRTKHTRYPVCNDSLDEVLGVVHVKDLVGIDVDHSFEWGSIMREPQKIPENMPISKLLRHFQSTHQLMAFVMDEYGTVLGAVTLENVLEQIVGSVEDEFDNEQPNITKERAGCWIVLGSTPIHEIKQHLLLDVSDDQSDTFSGYLMDRAHRLLEKGDRFELEGFVAEVLETGDDKATRIRVLRNDAPADAT